MKTLQNNYTTVEQSKRLLELEVPVWTADCYLDNNRPYIIQDEELYNLIKQGQYLPCWSVGRLIEIVSICYTGTKFYYSPKSSHKVEFWLERIEKWSKIGFMNFSKLEE